MNSNTNKNRIFKFDYSETDNSAFLESEDNAVSRLINPDGTFNIDRRGLSGSNIYEKILGLSWTKTILLFLVFYFLINSLFAFLFIAIGPEHISGIELGSFWHNYTQMLYFSIQTFTTVGYGEMSPNGDAANLIASFVAFTGLLAFALVTGLSFSKFSKPQAHILFSRYLLRAPNPNKNGMPSLQFRIVNTTNNQLIDLESRVTLAWLEEIDGQLKRKFSRLDLEMESIHLFPLNWTIAHNIDEQSPLFGLTKDEMISKHMELLILVKGFDDTYSQTVHSKRSYRLSELIDGARFISMYENTETKTVLHLSKIDEYENYQF